MKALKNIIITHLVMLVLFAGAAMALAQESTTTPKRTPAEIEASIQDRKAQMEERKLELEQTATERQQQIQDQREEVKTNIEERRAQLEARAQARITNLAANMSNRMEAVLARLQNITDRIESRIKKLNELGVNTEEAETALASAQMSIDAALAEIDNIDEAVNSAIGSEDVKTNWIGVKETYQKIHDHILTARAELRATVAALKTAVADSQETNNGVDEAVKTEPTPTN